MPLLPAIEIPLDTDLILRAQGADPLALRARRPDIVRLAEQALHEGQSLLDPKVLYAELDVRGLQHDRLLLEGGACLQGGLIAQHLAGATRVIILLCTVGDRIDLRAIDAMEQDKLYSLALDGVGSAATEGLANAACASFEQRAAQGGEQTSVPLSPGMIGWSVEVGQPQLLSILDAAKVGVRLTPQWMMSPRKSLTMVLGIGPDLKSGTRACDLCNLNSSCRYQDHFARTASQVPPTSHSLRSI